jgi:predicted house-cleaning noncanonical NTP pyrophosphatase (MazG superfamily)
MALLSYFSMGFHFPSLVRDKDPDLVRADGLTPRVRFVGDGELLQLLLGKIVEDVSALVAARGDEVLCAVADVRTTLRALCAEGGVTEDALAGVAALDGHAPRQLVDHAAELAASTSKDRVQLVANMRRSLENFCRQAGISVDALEEEEARRLAERGGFSHGIVLEGIEGEENKTK